MLSLCLTNYNRYEMLLESFQHVYDDQRISEIVISDDCSETNVYNKLVLFANKHQKIKLRRNTENEGMMVNKALAVTAAENEWCILFDSDNIINSDYLDALSVETLYPDTIYCPAFAAPNFDYRKYSGRIIDYLNVKEVVSDPMGNCLLNTCNYVVHRKNYIDCFRYDSAIKASDTIYFNHHWLKAGYRFKVVPNMQYFHRVHKGSGFLADTEYNLRQAEKTKQLIMQL